MGDWTDGATRTSSQSRTMTRPEALASVGHLAYLPRVWPRQIELEQSGASDPVAIVIGALRVAGRVRTTRIRPWLSSRLSSPRNRRHGHAHGNEKGPRLRPFPLKPSAGLEPATPSLPSQSARSGRSPAPSQNACKLTRRALRTNSIDRHALAVPGTA